MGHTLATGRQGRSAEHRWFSGRMLACHAGGPGSIPGRCKFFLTFWQLFLQLYIYCSNFVKGAEEEKKLLGDGGYRSPYLSHAKRALYHLSYVPLGGQHRRR